MSRILLCILNILPLNSCDTDEKNRINVVIPTAEQESEYVFGIIRDIKFYDEHNYDLSLPEGPVIDSLITLSRSGRPIDDSYDELVAYMKGRVYREADYEKGYAKIEKQSALINRLIKQVDSTERNWDFRTFETYEVTLTLYGPGGNYNPDDGSLLMMTTPDGEFKRYKDPVNIIMHEVTHIGLEESIISEYNVPHGLKERLVDTFVWLSFHDLLPEYRIQPMGDKGIDVELRTTGDLKDLQAIVGRFMSGN